MLGTIHASYGTDLQCVGDTVCIHFVFGIGRFIDLIVPDIPDTLQIKIKMEQ